MTARERYAMDLYQTGGSPRTARSIEPQLLDGEWRGILVGCGLRQPDVELDLQAPLRRRDLLSERLAKLVDEGVLERSEYREPGSRTRHEYRMTETGRELTPILLALRDFPGCKTVQKRAETCQKRAETVKKREKA